MKALLAGLSLTVVFAAPAIAADDPAEIFKEAIALYEDGDIDGALEEARWGVERLEQMKQKAESDYFLDEINEFKGGELSQQKAMGMQVTERAYTKGSQKVTVTLTGGDAGGGMGGLGAIMQMGGMMQGGRKVRIQRRSGFVQKDSNSVSVIITLESGGMLTFESSDMTEEELIAFAEAFPIAKLDEARG